MTITQPTRPTTESSKPGEIHSPNESGSAQCTVRWLIDTENGWVGAWDREALIAFAAEAFERGQRETWAACIAACLSKKVAERQTTLMHNLAVEDCAEAIEQLATQSPTVSPDAARAQGVKL